MKKQNKKNTKMGRNIYGQRCIAKVVVLKKETAIDQYVEILNDIEQHKRMNINVEYDIQMPKEIFSQEDINELNRKFNNLAMLRSGMMQIPFVNMNTIAFPMLSIKEQEGQRKLSLQLFSMDYSLTYSKRSAG